MATVTGPLYSTGATGSIAKALINYQGRHGKTVVRQMRPKPRRQPTEKQKATRANTALLVDLWHRLHRVDRANWYRNGQTAENHQEGYPFNPLLEGYHLFMQINGERVRDGKLPLFSPYSAEGYQTPGRAAAPGLVHR